MAKIPMRVLKPTIFRGLSVDKDDRIETESRKVAAVLIKLGRAREIQDFDVSESIEDVIKNEVARKHDAEIEATAVSDTLFHVKPAKRAYKRRGPKVRK